MATKRLEITIEERKTYVYTIRAVHDDALRIPPTVLRSGSHATREEASSKAANVAEKLRTAYVLNGKGPATIVELGTALDVVG